MPRSACGSVDRQAVTVGERTGRHRASTERLRSPTRTSGRTAWQSTFPRRRTPVASGAAPHQVPAKVQRPETPLNCAGEPRSRKLVQELSVVAAVRVVADPVSHPPGPFMRVAFTPAANAEMQVHASVRPEIRRCRVRAGVQGDDRVAGMPARMMSPAVSTRVSGTAFLMTTYPSRTKSRFCSADRCPLVISDADHAPLVVVQHVASRRVVERDRIRVRERLIDVRFFGRIPSAAGVDRERDDAAR